MHRRRWSRSRERPAGGRWGFWKVPAAVPGPGDEIVYPRRTEYFDYEGEAAVVIGKSFKDLSGDRLEEYVWGITLVNDWSLRDGVDNQPEVPRPISYNLAKNFDRSRSMGPCIVVGELTPQSVESRRGSMARCASISIRATWVWSFAEVMEYLSRDFTFVAGAVICGGTAAGTTADKTKPGPDGTRARDLFLKPDDLVEVYSPSIGILDNRTAVPERARAQVGMRRTIHWLGSRTRIMHVSVRRVDPRCAVPTWLGSA